MLQNFEFIAVLGAITLTIPIVTLLLSWLFRPKKPNLAKQETYESGIETVGDTWVQFKVQYYIYALVFVVFDVEAVFLFPIAAAFGQLSLFAVVATVLFVILLADGLVYAWSRGVLEWV